MVEYVLSICCVPDTASHFIWLWAINYSYLTEEKTKAKEVKGLTNSKLYDKIPKLDLYGSKIYD